MMKHLAILIDPADKSVSEIKLENDFGLISGILKYDSPGGTMPLRDESGLKHMMWSGLYQYTPDPSQLPESFRIPSLFGTAVFFGKGLILGYTPDGKDRCDSYYNLEYICSRIKMMSKKESEEELLKIIDAYNTMFDI